MLSATPMKKTVKTASKTIQAGSSGELSALMPAMRVLARITSAGTMSKRSLEAISSLLSRL